MKASYSTKESYGSVSELRFATTATISTLFSMGKKHYSMGGIMAPPSSNFVVSSSIMITFGVVIESDKFAPKSLNFNDVTAEL